MLNTGLMTYLTKWLTPVTIQNEAKSGQFFENFVVGKIIKSFHNQGQEPPIYFNLLRNTLPANELGIAHGTIINQYPQKIWLAENLVTVPAAYV